LSSGVFLAVIIKILNMADVKPAGSSSANRIRVYNPNNPRGKTKPWTYEQAATRKDLVERFVREVL